LANVNINAAGEVDYVTV